MRSRSVNQRRTANRQFSRLQERLATIEQTLTQRIVEQDAEIMRLRGALQMPAAENAGAAHTPLAMQHSSRRGLLRLGAGAAAGAAITAVAMASHPGTAYAAGTQWQTGTVNADVETIVKPSGPYSGPDILQLQFGTGSPYQPLASLKAALAAYDTTTNNIGVYGSSQTGYGLMGVTDTGVGANGAGINGTANSTGTGVAGTSASGVGVAGTSTNGVGGSFSGGLAPLVLGLSGNAPGVLPPGTHARGEIYLDSAANIYICKQAGTTGSGTPPAFYQMTSLNFLPAPVRIVGAGNPSGLTLTPNTTTTFLVTGANGIPAGAKGIFGNATLYGAKSSTGGGFLTLYPSGASKPDASTINYTNSDQPLSNFAFVGLGTDGKFAAYISVHSGGQFLFDVAGYII